MTQVYHFLYGELDQQNTRRLIPQEPDLEQVLHQYLRSHESSPVDNTHYRECCDLYAGEDIRPRVGLLSLPISFRSQQWQLVVRGYYAWAMGARVSMTQHAVLLNDDSWFSLSYNPFGLPHLVRTTAEFHHTDVLSFYDKVGQSDDWERVFEYVAGHSLPQWLAPAYLRLLEGNPVTLAEGTANWALELLVLLLPLDLRRRLRVGTNPFYRKDESAGLYLCLGPAPNADVPATDTAHEDLQVLIGRIAVGYKAAYDQLLKKPFMSQPSSVIRLDSLWIRQATSTPFQSEDQATPSKRLWPRFLFAGAALLLLGLFVYGPSWVYNGRVEDWFTDFQAKKTAAPLALIERLPDLLAEPPRWAAKQPDDFAKALQELKVVVQGNLGALTRRRPRSVQESGDCLALTHQYLAELQAVSRLNLEDHLRVRWDITKQQAQLFGFEAALINHFDQNQLETRRMLLNKSLAYYQGQADLPANPALAELRLATRKMEAKLLLTTLRQRVQTNPLNAVDLDDFNRLAESYSTNYDRFFPTQFVELKRAVYQRFHDQIAAPVKQAYSTFQSRIDMESLLVLADATAAYEHLSTHLPDLAGVRLLQTKGFVSRLKREPLVIVRIKGAEPDSIGKISWGLLHKRCVPQAVFPLFFDGELCLLINKRELRLPFAKVLHRRHNHRELTREILWPDL